MGLNIGCAQIQKRLSVSLLAVLGSSLALACSSDTVSQNNAAVKGDGSPGSGGDTL